MSKIAVESDPNYLVNFSESDAPPSTLKKALTSYFDLGSPLTPDRMEDWIEFATDEEEKEAMLKVHPCLH